MFGVFSALQIITSDPLILSKGLIMAMDIASADANYLIQSAELLDYSKIVMKQLIKKVSVLCRKSYVCVYCNITIYL